MELDLSTPRICEYCGEEVKCGLEFTIEHFDVCKRNAPNSSLFSHYIEEESKKLLALAKEEHDKVMNKLFLLLTYEERTNLVYTGLYSTLEGATRYKNYVQELLVKYQIEQDGISG